MSMDKFKDIFKAMSEGALLEVSLHLGEWPKTNAQDRESVYQMLCSLIASDTKFSCRAAHNTQKHAPLTFPAPVTHVSELSREEEPGDEYYMEYYVYYYPDAADCEVGRVKWKAKPSDVLRMENGLVYKNREDAEARLKAMLKTQPCTVYTVIYNGLVTN